MGRVLEFRVPPPKPLTPRQFLEQELTPVQAINEIVCELVRHIIPLWVEKRWPMRGLEILMDELRDAMSQNVPNSVSRLQVQAIVEELKPVWAEIAQQAIHIF